MLKQQTEIDQHPNVAYVKATIQSLEAQSGYSVSIVPDVDADEEFYLIDFLNFGEYTIGYDHSNQEWAYGIWADDGGSWDTPPCPDYQEMGSAQTLEAAYVGLTEAILKEEADRDALAEYESQLSTYDDIADLYLDY